MKFSVPLLVGVCLLLFAGACTKKKVYPDTHNRGTLIDAVYKGHLTAGEIAAHADKVSNAGQLVSGGVRYYALTYRTVYKGEPIDSRGLLLVPDDADTTYFLAYFHGTHLPVNLGAFYQSARTSPSNYNGGSTDFLETRNIGLIWASAGFTVFLPDYIGFGATTDKEHPYLVFGEMFRSNIDGLLAAKHFIKEQGTVYDDRIFLSGWSQGGGACLSAHRYIQEQYAGDFKVVASSGLAGPYNFKGFIDTILQKREERLNINNIFSWGVYSLNKFSPELKRPTDQIFSYAVYDQYAAIFPPSQVPARILNEFFLSHIMDGTDQAFAAVLQQNTFHEGWKPEGRVFLHHGAADNVVYYFNSVHARDGLRAAGGHVTLYSYPDGTHDSEVGNYVSNTLKDFKALQ